MVEKEERTGSSLLIIHPLGDADAKSMLELADSPDTISQRISHRY